MKFYSLRIVQPGAAPAASRRVAEPQDRFCLHCQCLYSASSPVCTRCGRPPQPGNGSRSVQMQVEIPGPAPGAGAGAGKVDDAFAAPDFARPVNPAALATARDWRDCGEAPVCAPVQPVHGPAVRRVFGVGVVFAALSCAALSSAALFYILARDAATDIVQALATTPVVKGILNADPARWVHPPAPAVVPVPVAGSPPAAAHPAMTQTASASPAAVEPAQQAQLEITPLQTPQSREAQTAVIVDASDAFGIPPASPSANAKDSRPAAPPSCSDEANALALCSNAQK